MKKFTLFLFITFIAKVTNAQNWSTVGTGLDAEYGRIESLCEYNGELYAGGYFDSIGGKQAFCIAKWNGLTWDSVPNSYFLGNYANPFGLNLEIFAMVVYNGELVVAGSTWENGNQPRNIAKWDGTAWSQLGTGFNNVVASLEVYNGELYATGRFDYVGGVPIRGIAKWNGSAWSNVGGPGLNLSPGFSGNALKTYNGDLYLAGNFYLINGLPAHSIAKWNGAVWDSVGTIDELWAFQSLCSYNNKLYAGGNMLINNNSTNDWIGSWNSTTWNSVGNGLNGVPSNMAVYNNELYAAGVFDTAGGAQALCIARWNDMQWNTVGGGLNLYHINVDTLFMSPFDTLIEEKEVIYAMCTYNNELYVGGTFTQIGGVNANSIAKWNMTGVSVNELSKQFSFSLFPNPFSDVVHIASQAELKNAQFVIHDVLGREIRKTNNMHGQHFTIERGNLSSGIYFITIHENENVWTEKLIVD